MKIDLNLHSSFFAEPSEPYVPEPGTVTLTITRDGPLDRIVRVKYRTRDETATVQNNDYVPIFGTQVVLEEGVREFSFEVHTLPDTDPEPDEFFYVELYDAEPEGTGTHCSLRSTTCRRSVV